MAHTKPQALLAVPLISINAGGAAAADLLTTSESEQLQALPQLAFSALSYFPPALFPSSSFHEDHMTNVRRALLASAIVFTAGLCLDTQIVSAPAVAVGSDQRTEIILDAAERDVMLAGMRTYLESVQGIVAALAENHPDRVASIAAKSGNKLLQTVSPLTAAKLPLAFMSMSFDTHDKFDKLAARAAKTASRSEVLSDLRDILGNCTSCHMSFRAVAPK